VLRDSGVAIQLGDGQFLYLSGTTARQRQADWFVFT